MSRLDPEPILNVLQRLLGPEGCPWDREQTPHSLCEYLVEEVFELVEAVRSGNEGEITDELGDVSFLLFFLTELLSREYGIGLQQAWETSAAKMRRRHPHVFDNHHVATRDELLKTWERIKSEERESRSSTRKHAEKMASLPGSLPPLPKAYRIHAKAAQSGFTWGTGREQAEALHQEWGEWEEVRKSSDHSRKEEEFGDLLFSLVEQGRREGIKANAALHRANQKFLRRFEAALALAQERGLDWEGLSMTEKDRLWEEVKAQERQQGTCSGERGSGTVSG
ncbi:MAG: nucleoside triphosphate pyrophosphohydrolase [Desulfohalobiaceae bacterium]|nr:nucleoside triphosphate pyrophosphohydrolase [Desulfohalobiaceae bacterium]